VANDGARIRTSEAFLGEISNYQLVKNNDYVH